jgi:hypothetical protein
VEKKPDGQFSSRDIGSNIVSKGFGIVMVILYVFLGITIIFKAVDIGSIPQNYARVFGVMLILYGIFRGYKLYSRYFSKSESES